MDEEAVYNRIGKLEQDCVLFKEQIKTLREAYCQVSSDIKMIKDRLLNRLPAWGTLLLTLLCSICSGLIVFSLRK